MQKQNQSEFGKLGAAYMKNIYNERLTKYNNNPKKCVQCSKDIPYEKRINKFCSHTCSAIYNNPLRITCKNTEILFCECCNKELPKLKKYRYGRKFCDKKCASNYRWEKTKRKIEAGESGIGVKSYKKMLLEVRGNKCEMCTTSEWLGKQIMLIMDHVDGNSENNKLNNLRLICSNCDATLPTYKSKNIGKGRKLRYKERQ